MRKTDQNLIDNRTQEILEAALRCFAATGFSAASMRHIAAASGVSLGLLYRYFDDKAAIVAAAISADSGEFSRRLSELVANGLNKATLLQFLEQEVSLRSEASVFALTAEIVAEAARNPEIAALIQQNVKAAEADLTRALAVMYGSPETAKSKQAMQSQACHLLGLVDLLAMRVFFKLKVNPREGLRLALET